MPTLAVSPPPVLHDTGLDITLDDGLCHYFNYYWLRDNCATSFDPETRERLYDIFAEPAPPRAAAAMIEDDALIIDWVQTAPNAAHRSTYPLAWLTAHATARPRPDPAILPRRYWFADHYPAMARFGFDAVRTDREALKGWVHALLTEGVAILGGMPTATRRSKRRPT